MIKKFICEICEKEFHNAKECKSHELECGKDYFYVAECFFASQTYYENPRFFSIFKKTVPVTDEFVKLFKKLEKDNYDLVNEIFYNQIIEENLPSIFMETLMEDFIECGDFPF